MGASGYLTAAALASEAHSTLQGMLESRGLFLVRKLHLIIFCVVLALKGGGTNFILRGSCKCLLLLVSVVECLCFTVVHGVNCRHWRKQVCVKRLCLHMILKSSLSALHWHICCIHYRLLNSHCRKETHIIALVIIAEKKNEQFVNFLSHIYFPVWLCIC